MSHSLVIATSLSPQDERGVQPAAIASWLKHGIRLLSVNTEDEIALLRPDFPAVQFVAVERTAERFAGRPVPYIYDLLKAAKDHADDGQAIGITNADIFLRSVDGLPAFLSDHAKGSLILGPRVDVDNQDDFSSYIPAAEPAFSVGYDYFIMSQDVFADFEDSPFAMGMPFWDFWLPLTAYLAGWPLKTLSSPVALHAAHETKWDDTIYLFFHAMIAYALDQSRKGGGVAEDDNAERRQLVFMLDVISHVYGTIFENGTASQDGQAPDQESMAALAEFYDRFQETAVHTIKSNALSIQIKDA